MADAGEIRVELKLLTEKAKQQAKQSIQGIKQEMARDLGGVPIRQSVADYSTATSGEAAGRAARLEELRRYRAQGLRGFNVQEFFRAGQAPGAGAGLATPPVLPTVPAPPYKGPVPPVIAPPVIPPGGWQGFQQRLMAMPMIAKVAAGFAVLTAGLAAVRVAIGLVRFAFNTLLAPLKELWRSFMQLAEQARRLYASALSSGGLPVGFVTRRNTLAGILGVGERDVWQYGQAIGYLNERIKAATTEVSKSVMPLTAVSWEWRVLQVNLNALYSQVARYLAPAVYAVVSAFADLAKAMVESQVAILAVRTVLQPLVDMMHLFALYVRLTAGINMERAANIPPPSASSQRLPASTWERMGLVIGVGAGQNAAQQTAWNTGKTVVLLERIAQSLAPAKTGYYSGIGMRAQHNSW